MRLKLFPLVLTAMLCLVLASCNLPGREAVQQFLPASQPAAETAIAAQLDTPISLKINQEAVLASENLSLQLLAVKEDSRCPEGVTCVQEGQVTVTLKVSDSRQKLETQMDLTSKASQAELASQSFGNYTIQLLSVEPYPKTTETIKPLDYSVTLAISQLGVSSI